MSRWLAAALSSVTERNDSRAGSLARSQTGGALAGWLPPRIRSQRLRPSRRTRRFRPAWGVLLAIVVLLAVAVRHEIRTSALQSRMFSTFAAKASYQIRLGPSELIVYPESGPFDQRRGYARLPDFRRRLQSRGYHVAEQASLSPLAARLARWGVALPYREPPAAGLAIRDAAGADLYSPGDDGTIFTRFEDVPPLIVRTLLFIENRELLDPPDPRTNPAVDWGRLATAGVSYAGSKIGLPMRVEGGSTLATQLEKYRHSAGGRTSSMLDKLKQMTAASLKAYRIDRDTRDERHEIILDYLNTMPLAAAPGFGEVHGLGEGLRAWFGLDLAKVSLALDDAAPAGEAKARAFKQVLALLYAVRAPSHYLAQDRPALSGRVDSCAKLLEQAGIIDADLERRVSGVALDFRQRPVRRKAAPPRRSKPTDSLRSQLMRTLGISGLYELDRLDLDVDTTIDGSLQEATMELFRNLAEREFVEAKGLRAKHLLAQGDPREVLYSLMLIERTPRGNLMRVQADSLQQPFDVNTGMKVELGSTAKLRVLAHYLDVMSQLYDEMKGLDATALDRRALAARDAITYWAGVTLRPERSMGLEAFLSASLDRTYSASPHEVFFTGAGDHIFENFEPEDNGRTMSVREGFVRSTNLVFVRLMRDLVRFHEARLPYDARAILAQENDPERRAMLEEIAQDEARQTLERAYHQHKDLTPAKSVELLLGRRAAAPRPLTILFYAWHPGAGPESLDAWLQDRMGGVEADDLRRLVRAYGNPRLSLADYGYLLDRHPLEIWCAGEVARTPGISWEELLARSGDARRVASAWLFRTRSRHAQDLRLRARIERDAFERMTPSWRRLGFPFERLVPSYATALGSSSDRPAALAGLMGIILDDGLRIPERQFERLRFAADTPYHTVFEANGAPGERVMRTAVARALRDLLALVVEDGTARRVDGAFRLPDGTAVPAGGKTGSGDNRFETVARGGRTLSSRATSRTATFVFYVGDRYYGVVTASVSCEAAKNYRFTSSLPLAVLRLLAPEINRRLASPIPTSSRTAYSGLHRGTRPGV